MLEFITESPEATRSLGERLGAGLQAGDRVLLFGDLGAGKTTLVQGLCRGLGVPEEDYVRSPTFTLVNQYRGRHPVYHIDLYRIDSAPDLETLGLEEILESPSVSLVEWAEKLFFPSPSAEPPPPLPLSPRLEIHLEIVSDTGRKIRLKPVGPLPESHPVFSLQ